MEKIKEEKKTTTAKKEVVEKVEEKIEPVEETAVIEKPEMSLAERSIQQKNGLGMENTTAEDITIPYAKLMQSKSPEVEEEDIAKVGDILNSLTKESYGKEILIIPLQHRKKRIWWKPRVDGGGILCGSSNSIEPDMGEMHAKRCHLCENQKWNGNVPPLCTLFHDYPALVLHEDREPEMIFLSFGKTSFKTAGQKLISLAQSVGGNIFACKYKLSTSTEKNSEGQTYKIFNIDPAGFVSDAEYKIAEERYQFLMKTDFKVHNEDENVEPLDPESELDNEERPF